MLHKEIKQFSLREQEIFSALSGDKNPMHVDTVYARRLLFGGIVVHGVHLLLCGINEWLNTLSKPSIIITAIRCSFIKPVTVNEKIQLEIEEIDKYKVLIKVLKDEALHTKIELTWRESEAQSASELIQDFPLFQKPNNLNIDEIENRSGELGLYYHSDLVKQLFPAIYQSLSTDQVSVILATTRLVGMECPGLHSLYSQLDLDYDDSKTAGNKLQYNVCHVDKRFGLVEIQIESPVFNGKITAFVRPSPKNQENCSTIKRVVSADEFTGQRALVIGGTRGLGEVTCKLLAIGGADVKFTYYQGVKDAESIVEDIRLHNGLIESIPCNVLDPQFNISNSIDDEWKPTHLYYYATPYIAMGNKHKFSKSVFMDFCNYYLFGFQSIFEQVASPELKGVLYPSTVFINEVPNNMGEYATAKVAGEMLCAFFNKKWKDVKFHNPRLPKTTTDQTASLIETNDENPVPMILQHLRQLQGHSSIQDVAHY